MINKPAAEAKESVEPTILWETFSRSSQIYRRNRIVVTETGWRLRLHLHRDTYSHQCGASVEVWLSGGGWQEVIALPSELVYEACQTPANTYDQALCDASDTALNRLLVVAVQVLA